jgi:hypothetical protein
MESAKFTKGTDPKLLLYSAGGIVIGAIGIVAGFLHWFTLRYHNFCLPYWVLVVAGVGAIILSIVGIMAAFNAEKCSCGGTARIAELNFAMERKDAVVAAAQNFDAAALPTDFVPELSENITLYINYCTKCQQVCTVKVEHTAKNHADYKRLVRETPVPSDKAGAFVEFAMQYDPEDD